MRVRTRGVLAAALVSACSSAQPTAPAADGGADASADVAAVQCGAAWLNGAECAACTEQTCCAQAKACDRDPTCAAHVACLDACDPADRACLLACEPSPDAGVDELFAALRDCELDQCQTSCPFDRLACGALSSPVASCDACLTSQCCAEEGAVGTSADALHYGDCVAACARGDAACQDTCASQHPSGSPLAHDLEACTQEKCLGACPNPSVACIGNVQPPTLTKSAIQYGVAVLDDDTHAPVAGAVVKICDRSDVACQSPLAEGQSDPSGHVGFVLPVTSPGFVGFADVSAVGYFPTLFVAGAPIVDDVTVGVLLPLLSSAAAAAKQAGTSLDPLRASIVVAANGCDGVPLPYVSVSVDTADNATTLSYLGPNVTTTTGPRGIAIAFNVPVAPAAIVASFALTGQVVSSTSNVPTRAGTLTQVPLAPK